MSLIIASIKRGARSLFSGAMVRILILAMLLNTAFIAAVIGLIWLGLQAITFVSWGWLENLIDGGLLSIAIWLSTFIYPLLLPVIISFFDTAIADKIEQREYPDLPEAQPPFWPNVSEDIRFTLKVIIINILMIPLYFIPIINFFCYYGVNGYLLGREFFHVIAGRHISREAGLLWRARYAISILMIGGLITFAATLPFVNIIAPILGVASMVHLFHATNPPYKRYDVISDGGVIVEG